MLPVDYVFLEYSAKQGQAALREISGHEEWMVNGTNTHVSIHLIDRLLVDIPGAACQPGSAAELTAADRDRLLAAIYQRNYGRRIVATLTCSACGNPFDLDFDLAELLESLNTQEERAVVERRGDSYVMADGSRFRLPTGKDEVEIAQLAPELALAELRQRCMMNQGIESMRAVQDAMQAIAPLIDLELEAKCAVCGKTQPAHFNLQHYLLAAIHAEQPRLAREVHLLATAYGWRLDEILSLTRSQRRGYVALIEDQQLRSRRRVPA